MPLITGIASLADGHAYLKEHTPLIDIDKWVNLIELALIKKKISIL